MRHGIQASLRMFGDMCEDHGNTIANVLVAGTGDDDTAALKLAAVMR